MGLAKSCASSRSDHNSIWAKGMRIACELSRLAPVCLTCSGALRRSRMKPHKFFGDRDHCTEDANRPSSNCNRFMHVVNTEAESYSRSKDVGVHILQKERTNVSVWSTYGMLLAQRTARQYATAQHSLVALKIRIPAMPWPACIWG